MKKIKYLPVLLIMLGMIFLEGCYTTLYMHRGYNQGYNSSSYYSNQDSAATDSTFSNNYYYDYPDYGYWGLGNRWFYSSLWGDNYYWDPFYNDYWDSPYYWSYDPYFYGSFYYPSYGESFHEGFHQGFHHKNGDHEFLNNRIRNGHNFRASVQPRRSTFPKGRPSMPIFHSRNYPMSYVGSFGRSGGMNRGASFGRSSGMNRGASFGRSIGVNRGGSFGRSVGVNRGGSFRGGGERVSHNRR